MSEGTSIGLVFEAAMHEIGDPGTSVACADPTARAAWQARVLLLAFKDPTSPAIAHKPSPRAKPSSPFVLGLQCTGPDSGGAQIVVDPPGQ